VVVRTRNTPDIWVPQLSAKDRHRIAQEQRDLAEFELAETYARIYRASRRLPRRERDNRVAKIWDAVEHARRRDLAKIRITPRSGPLDWSDDDNNAA